MKSLFKLVVWLAIIAGILFLVGWAFLFEAHQAPNNAMAPNIIRDDKFLVYVHATLSSGTPVVCSHPDNEGEIVVGRIIGEPGDRVKIRQGAVEINGDSVEHTVENEYVLVDDRNTDAPQTLQLEERIETFGMIRYRIVVPQGGDHRSRRRMMREKTVPDDSFFLLADNRSFGDDSRVYGPVKISSCIGRPLLIYQPAESSGDAGNGSRWFNIVR